METRITRQEAEELVTKQFDEKTVENKSAHHYGRCEAHDLLDAIYGEVSPNKTLLQGIRKKLTKAERFALDKLLMLAEEN